jgi:DNA-binding GntR family transcriptional regulator
MAQETVRQRLERALQNSLASARGRNATPLTYTARELAEWLGCSEGTVNRALGQLVQEELVERTLGHRRHYRGNVLSTRTYINRYRWKG